jgi:hypothetical protein
MTRLLEDCELIGRLDRDEEDTEGSMGGITRVSCFFGMVGGGDGGLGLDSGEESGLSSRGKREVGAWYTGGLEGIGVGMGSFIFVSTDLTRLVSRTLKDVNRLGGMEKRDLAVCCCTLVVAAAGAF